MKRSELIFAFFLVPLDALMILISFVVAYYWRKYQGDVVYFWPFLDYLKFILYILPFWIIFFAFAGLYNTKKTRQYFNEFTAICLAVSSGIMLVVAWIFLSRTFFFSRLIIVYSWILCIVIVAFGRQLVHFIQKYLYKYNIGVRRLILVGNNYVSYNILKEIQNNRNLGYKLVGLITTPDDKGYRTKEHLKILGSILELEDIINKNPVDDIILTNPNISDSRVLRIIQFCQENQISFKQTPNLFKVRTSNVELATIAGVPIVEFKKTPLDGWGAILKRIFDIIFSLAVLVIFSPIYLMISLLVKIDSPGPVLFRQKRVGLNGQFTFYKFRTMRDGSEEEHLKYMRKYGNMFKLKNDPRVTKFGKFLRKYSIDELPQFWNVLIGDMSVVGPRPPMPEEVAKYSANERKRLGIKPGISGLWQVSGRSDIIFDEWIKLDIYYIENWSFWLDFKIIMKTVAVVLGAKGAY